MRLFILLHDHNDVEQNRINYDFTDQTTMDDLEKQIKDGFYIEPRHQQLFYANNLLEVDPTSTVVAAGLKHMSKLILKHALLDNWKAFLDEIEKIRALTTSGATNKRKDIALRGRQQLSPLDESTFFVVYPKLVATREEIDSELNYLVHNTEKYMHRSVTAYFKSLFIDQEVEIVKKSKQAAGVQLGYFVYVKNTDGQIHRSYYAKMVGNTDYGEKASIQKEEIDLNELFVYHLLKQIGLGANEVHIVKDTTRSECVYLATELINGFRTFAGKTVDDMLGHSTSNAPKTSIPRNNEYVKKLNLLEGLFCLNDLTSNTGNFGFIEETNELRIVDFRVNPGWTPKISKAKETVVDSEKFFNDWNLVENIEEAKKSVLDDPAIKDNKNDLETYVNGIIKTLANFQNNPRKTSAD